MGEQRGEAKAKRSRARRFSPRLFAALVLCLAGIGLAPGEALAGKAEPLGAFFYTEAGNGFMLYAEAYRLPGRGASVSVELAGDDQSVTYEKNRGVRLTRDHLSFRLGSLGSVDMDFEGKRMRNGRCEGAVIRTGFLRGRLHFRGEDSYTVAHAGRARAAVQAGNGRGRCGFSHRDDRGFRETTLSSCGPGPQLSFVAQAIAYFDFSVFGVTLQERVDGLDIYRSATGWGESGEFSFDEKNYETAKLRPAWPFAGTGTYEDGELSGDLSVSLPGRGTVPLAPSSRAKLRKKAVAGRACGVDSGPPPGFYAAPGSAPEDPAAVGFYRR
jgi:hypothetical protein